MTDVLPAPGHPSKQIHGSAIAAEATGEASGVVEWLRLASRPTELFEQAVSGGAMRYSGPARVSARALQRLCAAAGQHYTLVPRRGAAVATVEVGAPVAWGEPPGLAEATPREVVSYLRGALSAAATIEVLPAKLCGATRVVRAKPAETELRVPSTVLDKLLGAPGVLDAVLEPSAVTVTLAAASDKIGSLSHLAHSGPLAPRLTRHTPPVLPAQTRAGKTRRARSRKRGGRTARALFGRGKPARC